MPLLRLVPPDTKVNFNGIRLWCFAISLTLAVVSIASLAIRGLNFGIDFKGGIVMDVRAPEGTAIGHLRTTLGKLDVGEVQLQTVGQGNEYLIRLPQLADSQAEVKMIAKTKELLGPGFDYRQVEFVGPKVGKELVRKGILAVVLAMGSIMVYVAFRFEWQFGLAGVIALFHDTLIVLGVFSLIQWEFNLTTLAAVLTIAGYSINDTVVNFDRIRENMRKYKTMPLIDLINLSLNETLSRTVLTHLTVFLTVLALFLVGGPVIHGFSFAMLLGVVLGSYSSVYIANPLLLYLNVRASDLKGKEADAAS